MSKTTHASEWKKNPSKRNVFVTAFAHHSFPFLNKNKKIKKVLDVACGNGLGVTLPLLRRGLNVSAFDHLTAALNAVKKNAKAEGFKVKTKKASMYKPFPYKDKTFDSTFCFQAIYHGRLEQIMHTLSEIKRVTKKGGYFFATFLSHDTIKREGKKFYIKVELPDKTIRNYHKQDKSEPHLYYYLSKDFEYMQPHYYFSKNELKVILKQYFSEVNIKAVCQKDKRFTFWFIAAKV